jgi:hypothetical protein
MLTLSLVMIPCDWIGIGDDPQRHTPNALHERDNKNQPWSTRWTPDLPELEHHSALVLLDDVRSDHGNCLS